MKKYNTLYYLLFVLLIMGAFASMAQNAYGFVILGSVAFAFSFIFAFQLYERLLVKNFREGKLEDSIELGSLAVVAAILGLRVFYIHFLYVGIIFGSILIVLVIIYFRKIFSKWRQFSSNTLMRAIVTLFYLSIICYLLSMAAAAFFPYFLESLGQAAFILIFIVVLFAIIKRKNFVDGEKRTILYYILRLHDKTALLAALFIVFTAYMGLTKIDVIPRMYSNEYPQAYFELVSDAEGDIEKKDDGAYRYEDFKKQYELFLEHNEKRSPIE